MPFFHQGFEDFDLLPRFAASPWLFQEPHFPVAGGHEVANSPRFSQAVAVVLLFLILQLMC